MVGAVREQYNKTSKKNLPWEVSVDVNAAYLQLQHSETVPSKWPYYEINSKKVVRNLPWEVSNAVKEIQRNNKRCNRSVRALLTVCHEPRQYQYRQQICFDNRYKYLHQVTVSHEPRQYEW